MIINNKYTYSIEVVNNLGGPENVLAGILMSLTGDVSGMIMFLIHKPFVKILLTNLLGMDIEDNFDLDEMSQSAIKEVGNIIAASYVNAIAELTGLAIEISPPELSVDMVGSILSLPAIYYANISDKIIFIKDELDKEDAASSQINTLFAIVFLSYSSLHIFIIILYGVEKAWIWEILIKVSEYNIPVRHIKHVGSRD